MGLEKERAKFRLVKARLNAGKNSPVDYFCDASASGPTIGTNIKNIENATIAIVFEISSLYT